MLYNYYRKYKKWISLVMYNTSNLTWILLYFKSYFWHTYILLSQRESFVTVKIFESKILMNFDVFEGEFWSQMDNLKGLLIVYLWNNVFMENKIRKKWNFILKYTFKKIIWCTLSLRKHSAKAVSSGFFIHINIALQVAISC